MKILKKFVALVVMFLGLGVFVGCENTNEIRSAYFTNATVSGSDQNTIKVVLQSDSRVDEKEFDVQVRASKETQVEFYEENGQKLNLTFKNTVWNSLTTLIVNAQNKDATENFSKYKDVQSKIYVFVTDQDLWLTFRVVVGEAEENSKATGYILTNSKAISNEFKIKLVKKK